MDSFESTRSARRVVILALTVVAFGVGVIAQQASGKGDPEGAKIKNPVATSPESIAAGQKTFDTLCAACHGKGGKGGIVLSVIEDTGGTQPPDLTDEKWDHGSSDGELFTVVKKGIGPAFFMAPFDGRISDTDIWNTVNYIKSLSQKK
jgi:mono/diheme cytochrome c family protein